MTTKRHQSYDEFTAEERRRLVLEVLERTPDCSANDTVLLLACERFGYTVDRAGLRGDLHWLYDSAIIKVEVLDGVWKCTLTNLGLDIVKSRRVFAGIARPKLDG